jgi:hypothetical protein
MNETERNETPEGADLPATADAGDSAARRRALLKGMSSGAALAAAALPMSALATGGRKHCFHKDTPHKKCKATVSGMHSAIASNMVNDWPESPGKHCSHYQNSNNWPSDSNGKFCRGHGDSKFRRDALYRTVFNCGGGGYNDKTIGWIMDNQINCPQRHWITACLNATKYGTQFSYTPSEVVSLHNNPSKNLDAQVFFKDYQENYN